MDVTEFFSIHLFKPDKQQYAPKPPKKIIQMVDGVYKHPCSLTLYSVVICSKTTGK